MLEQLLEKKLKEQVKAAAPGKAKAPATTAPAKKGKAENKPASSGSEKKNKKSERPAPTPKSDKNKDKEKGALSYATCWGCSWPGHTKKTCPECSGNEKGSE